MGPGFASVEKEMSDSRPAALARNFSAGPGALPKSVLEEAQRAVVELPGTGVSILGLSHRSKLFRRMLDEAEERIVRLTNLPKNFRVLFLQGGGTLQFSMVPMALLPKGAVADYVVGGYWTKKAVGAARLHGDVRVAWNGEGEGFRRLPRRGETLGDGKAAYLHYASNETVEGLQFRAPPRTSSPLVCDASSDFLSAPLDMSNVTLLYAHAQKNIGPAGVTIVLVSDDALAQSPSGLPPVLDYKAHAGARSLLHTPPVFSIYVVLLSLRWLENDVGGLANMGRINAEKARIVRGALARSASFYEQDVEAGFESDMNVTFRCPTRELDARFVAEAEAAGMVGTEGHRSRGGLRVSLYNGVTLEDARAIATFIEEFAEESAEAGASRSRRESTLWPRRSAEFASCPRTT
jgi:phosphoserine aminotransferase